MSEGTVRIFDRRAIPKDGDLYIVSRAHRRRCARRADGHGRRTALRVVCALLFAALLTGCAGTLDRSIAIANALGAVAASAGPQIERDYVAAHHDCLWTGTGAPSPLDLDAQARCMAKTTGDYTPALAAWDAFQAAWGPLPMLVAMAQALDSTAGKPVMIQLEAALPKVIAAAQALTQAYMGLASPKLPAKAVP